MNASAGRAASARPWLAALLALTALRVALAASLLLAPDETYYWLWSRHLQPGYFDDAPLIALWVRIGIEIAGPSPLGIRLLSPLAAALGSLLLWRAGEDFFPGRNAGITAAALLNATLVLGVGSIVTTPDTPLLLFWTATLAALGRWHATGDDRWWLAAGLAAGQALDAKYTGLLVFAVAGFWLLGFRAGRAALRRPLPWAGLALGFCAFLPVLIWNAQHDWVSFAKQGGRSAHLDIAHAPGHFLAFIFGQFGLGTPIVVVLMAIGTWRAARSRDPAQTLIAISVLLPAFVFLEHTLSGAVQANWPSILYPGAALAAAGAAPAATRRWRTPALALGLAITALVYIQALASPIPIPPRRDPIALQLAGWPQLGRNIAKIAAHQPVFSTDYATISELAAHLPAGAKLIAAGHRWQYFSFPRPQAPLAGILVQSDRRGPPPPFLFGAIRKIGHLTRTARGAVVQGYTIYHVALRVGAPAAILRNDHE